MQVSPYIFPGLPQTDTLQRLLHTCCKAAKVEVEEAQGSSRCHNVVLARQLYFWCARKYTRKTLQEIGALVNVTHPNVIHHLRVANDYLKVKDPAFMQLYERVA